MWSSGGSMEDGRSPIHRLDKVETNLSTESDYSDSDQEKPKSIIRKSISNGHSSSSGSSRKSILIRRHSEPSSPEEACSSSRGSECLSGNGGDSSMAALNTVTSSATTASVQVFGGSSEDAITILVESTRFIINPALFRSHPETMLGRMFSVNSINSSITRPNEHGEFEITENVSASCFKTILEFYKEGTIHCPDSVSVQELRDACDYFLIPFNTDTVKCQNLRSLLQEISNQGAKEQFAHFIETLVTPVLVQIAQQGDREGHIVVLAEDDMFQWDDEYPPPLGEEPSQIIRNNALYRFFRYVENRDVAKILLKERGFKKIRLGVEGFPTTLEKVKKKAGGRIEVIYNYIQRAFIHMSWEEEDAKSRHVDFQCIRIKTKTNPAPLVVAAADTEQDVAAVQQAVDDIANDQVVMGEGAGGVVGNGLAEVGIAQGGDGGLPDTSSQSSEASNNALLSSPSTSSAPNPPPQSPQQSSSQAGATSSSHGSSTNVVRIASPSSLVQVSNEVESNSNTDAPAGPSSSPSASNNTAVSSVTLPLSQQPPRSSPYHRERVVHLANTTGNNNNPSGSGGKS